MNWTTALRELGGVLEGMDRDGLEAACALVAGAGAVMGYGCGREGLMMRALVMRLHHLGLRASVQGDMAAPPLGPGDLFVCSAGPGQLSTVTSLMGRARSGGAEVLLLTAEPARAPVELATRMLVIPAQTMASDQEGKTSMLPMGSLYEGAMFLVFEAMVLRLQDLLGETAESMRRRHTNME